MIVVGTWAAAGTRSSRAAVRMMRKKGNMIAESCWKWIESVIVMVRIRVANSQSLFEV
jgi:hypothetical protein